MSPWAELHTKDLKNKEIQQIKSPTLHSAFVTLGKLQQKEIKQALRQSLSEYDSRQQALLLQKADRLYQQLLKLSDSYLFKIGKVNYLDRYLQALRAYAIGANIDLLQAVYLQLDIYPGCQTLIVQDTASDTIRFLHTEENALDSDFTAGKYTYRLTTMRFGKTHITFFAYPGLCGWGPAFCVNHNSSMVQLVDDLYAQPTPEDGPLWVNAFVFMAGDAADPDIVKELIERTHQFQGYLFTNGHACHQIYESPLKVISFEALHKNAKLVPPLSFTSKRVTAQSNIPRHPANIALSESYLPPAKSRWSRSRLLLYQEMTRRARRLEAYGRHLPLSDKNATSTITFLESFISASIGDLEIEDQSRSRHEYIQTGISSPWTVATVLGHISAKESKVKVIKGVPEPIYSVALLQDLLRDDLMTKDIYTKANTVLNDKTH